MKLEEVLSIVWLINDGLIFTFIFKGILCFCSWNTDTDANLARTRVVFQPLSLTSHTKTGIHLLFLMFNCTITCHSVGPACRVWRYIFHKMNKKLWFSKYLQHKTTIFYVFYKLMITSRIFIFFNDFIAIKLKLSITVDLVFDVL